MYEGYTPEAIAEKCKHAAHLLRAQPCYYEQDCWHELLACARIPGSRTYIPFWGGEHASICLALIKLRRSGKTLEQIATWLERVSPEDNIIVLRGWS